MKTRLAIKLGAVALALLVNSLILGGTTFVVGSRSQGQPDESPVNCTRAKVVHFTLYVALHPPPRLSACRSNSQCRAELGGIRSHPAAGRIHRASAGQCEIKMHAG